MKRVLVLGENAVDVVMRLSSFDSEEDHNNVAVSSKVDVGGSGINFARALFNLKETPIYFTPISKDFFGMSIRNFLDLKGISYFDVSSEKPTPVVVSVIQDNKRFTIANIFNTSYTDLDFDVFMNANLHFDYAYISGGLLTEKKPQEESIKIVEYISNYSNMVFFDPQVRICAGIPNFKETAEKIIYNSHVVFANQKELEYFNKSNIELFLNRGGILIIKRGKNGAKFITKDQEYEVKGIHAKENNLVGAGDVFNASFVKAIVNGENYKGALNFANTFASNFVEKGFCDG